MFSPKRVYSRITAPGWFESNFGWVDRRFGGKGLIVAIAIVALVVMWKRLADITDSYIDANKSQTKVNERVANQLEAMTALISINTERINKNIEIIQWNKEKLGEGVDLEKDMYDRVKSIEQNWKNFNTERGKK